jgi:glycosyltransferase involved in cell wall biosynthesis
MTRVAAVIPAYNEAGTIRHVAERTLRQVQHVIVVDDGSTDGTSAALAGLPLVLLSNAENRGKGASLWRGIERALSEGVETVVTLDGDGQHAPEEIARLLTAHAQDRNAIIIASRMQDRLRIPRDRYLAQRVGDFCIGWAARRPIEDSQSGFRIYPAALFRSLKVRTGRAGGFVFESEILIDAARAGTEVITVPVPAIYEQRGRRSHFRPVLDFTLIGWMVACKIVSRGFDPVGLARSLRGATPRTGDSVIDR